MRLICLFLVSASLIGLSSLPSVAQDKKEPKKDDVIKISTDKLAKEFWDNENDAIKKYKGKTIEVDGKVGQELKQILGDIWRVHLDAKVGTVFCNFTVKTPAFDEGKKLKKGQTVKIKGVCDGGNQYGPQIKECSVVPSK